MTGILQLFYALHALSRPERLELNLPESSILFITTICPMMHVQCFEHGIAHWTRLSIAESSYQILYVGPCSLHCCLRSLMILA